MSELDKFLAPRKGKLTTPFDVDLVVPEVGSLNISGKVARADGKVFRRELLDAKRAVATGQLDAEDFESELILKLVSDVKADGESISEEQVKQLLVNYPQLVEAIDVVASKDAVFTVPHQSGSSNTQKSGSGSPSRAQKAQK